MKLYPSEFIDTANECGIYISDDGALSFSCCPVEALYEFYKSIEFAERKLVLEILGNVIERERATRSA